MEFRKLIQLGQNSYVISIPKKWIEKYQLEKGDLITFNKIGNSIILSPTTNPEKEEHIRTITIEKQSTRREIKRKLLSLYEHNATTIILEGKGVDTHTQTITKLIDTLIGLEVIEQDKEKIIAKTYIKTEDVDIIAFIKRADNTIRSMLTELIESIEKNTTSTIPQAIKQREQNIDKITRLLQRTIRERLYKQEVNSKSNPLELIRYYQLITFLEKISDYLEKI
ncbi:MAG: PhoU domain-containing protein, partial [Nanobdellota archaeon]